MAHYRANVCHYAMDCFKHFDNEQKMFAWISERIEEKVSSYEECEEWTTSQEYDVAHTNGYIEILEIPDVKEFYRVRREYVTELQKAKDLMEKVQRMPKSARRDRLFDAYTFAYENANDLYAEDTYIWYGEI